MVEATENTDATTNDNTDVNASEAVENNDQTLASGGSEDFSADADKDEGGDSLVGDAKDGDKGGDTDEGGDKKPKEGDKTIPETYEVVDLPEGMEIDQEMLDTFTPVFKELGVDQEGFNKIMEKYVPALTGQAEATRQQALKDYKNTVDAWKKDTLKELGADSKKSLALVAKARDKFGDEELVEVFNETGIGNHPAIVRMLAKVGGTISEDAFPDSDTDGGKKDPSKVLYPNSDHK